MNVTHRFRYLSQALHVESAPRISHKGGRRPHHSPDLHIYVYTTVPGGRKEGGAGRRKDVRYIQLVTIRTIGIEIPTKEFLPLG